jgi:hypothetical protein
MFLLAKKYKTWLVLSAVVLIVGIFLWTFAFAFSQRTTPLIQEAVTPYANVYNYLYKGCWNASGTEPNGEPKALPNRLTGKTNIYDCVAEGAKNNYLTVGLTYNDVLGQNECWAGNKNATSLVNNYKVNGPVTDPASCEDIDQPGPNSLMVYSTLNEPVETPIDGYRYGGCWKDKSEGSYFTTQLGPVDANTNLSLTDCIGFAKSGNYDTVAYKAGGICYGGNQGKDGLNYKTGGEIPNNDKRCDVGAPGSETNIIYTTDGPNHDTPIQGYDYLGCYNDPSMPLGEIGRGFTLDQCINAAKTGGKFAGQGKGVGKYDTIYFTNQNVCKGATLGAGSQLTPGTKLDNDESRCNAYYPVGDVGLVYSTSTVVDHHDHTNPSFDADLLEKIKNIIGISGNEPTRQISDYQYKGYWVESTGDRTVGNFIGSMGLEQCVDKAKAAGYNTVSFQNKNQCWAGTDANYKKYGKATKQSLNDPNTTVAAIYMVGNEPSRHVYCGSNQEGVESMEDVPQPAYTIPQTTTVMFEPVPKTNTIITYSQTPIQPIETSSSAAASAPSSSTGGATDTSPMSQSNPVSGMNSKDRAFAHKSWLPNTPFVYENKKDGGNSSDSSSAVSGAVLPNSDIINNQYPSSGSSASSASSDLVTEPNNVGLEFFTTVSKVPDKVSKKLYRESIESMSPPPETVPGPFVPKTMIVPPVCPSIPPVIIKTDCSVCKDSTTKSGSASSGSNAPTFSNVNQQMSNSFANTNSPNGNPYSTSVPPASSQACNIRSYDNIPQPYLPSFSGFGM